MNFNIGPRMMKTGLSVALTILVTETLDLQFGIVAVLTSVVAMQPSIMRSVSYIKEVALSTLIGISFALAGAYTLGLQPVSFVITVILDIVIILHLACDKPVIIYIIMIVYIIIIYD